MPISLNTFQNTLSTTNLDGFIKLSGDGSSVKSYGDGFFARHFGLYTKPSVEENNAVRRAFYESVTSSIDCRGAVLDALRKDLGIGEGFTQLDEKLEESSSLARKCGATGIWGSEPGMRKE